MRMAVFLESAVGNPVCRRKLKNIQPRPRASRARPAGDGTTACARVVDDGPKPNMHEAFMTREEGRKRRAPFSCEWHFRAALCVCRRPTAAPSRRVHDSNGRAGAPGEQTHPMAWEAAARANDRRQRGDAARAVRPSAICAICILVRELRKCRMRVHRAAGQQRADADKTGTSIDCVRRHAAAGVPSSCRTPRGCVHAHTCTTVAEPSCLSGPVASASPGVECARVATSTSLQLQLSLLTLAVFIAPTAAQVLQNPNFASPSSICNTNGEPGGKYCQSRDHALRTQRCVRLQVAPTATSRGVACRRQLLSRAMCLRAEDWRHTMAASRPRQSRRLVRPRAHAHVVVMFCHLRTGNLRARRDGAAVRLYAGKLSGYSNCHRIRAGKVGGPAAGAAECDRDRSAFFSACTFRVDSRNRWSPVSCHRLPCTLSAIVMNALMRSTTTLIWACPRRPRLLWLKGCRRWRGRRSR
jgi:hypothetical protein